MRLADVQRVCDISKTENFDKWRTRVGKDRWEHREKTGDHRGVWVWSPGWFSAYGALRASDLPAAAGTVDQELSSKQRADAIKLRNLELDLDEREIKHAERRQTLMPMAAFNEAAVRFVDEIRRVIGTIPIEYQRLIIDGLNYGRRELVSELNGHSDPRLIGDIDGIRPPVGDRVAAAPPDSPRVRAKVRRDAPRRTKGRPEVS